jgi:hypothetical protein
MCECGLDVFALGGCEDPCRAKIARSQKAEGINDSITIIFRPLRQWRSGICALQWAHFDGHSFSMVRRYPSAHREHFPPPREDLKSSPATHPHLPPVRFV